jgi:hypothetical protein
VHSAPSAPDAAPLAPPGLRDLALQHGTDKEGKHSYAAAYERHLGHLRDRPIRLLEIGVGGHTDPRSGGASLRMWKAFFPRATIVGVDVVDKSALAEDRIVIVRGNQGDRAFLERLAADHGPFDVVIDDGSHWCTHVITTFSVLFPHLTQHGIYAIEDLQTSYWETYGGSSGSDRSGTSMTMLQGLVDGLNHAEFDVIGYQPSYTDRWVTSITFYHNLAFIQKGPNDEGSTMLPAHPRSVRRFAKPAPRPRARASKARRWIRKVVPIAVRRVGIRLADAIRARGARG